MAAFGFIKRFLDFIIYSNVFIGLCVAFFTLQTAVIFPSYEREILPFVGINFISTFILYNLQRLYYAGQEKENYKYVWYNKNRRLLFTLIVVLIFCTFSFLWNFFTSNYIFVIFYAFLALLSLVYFLPPFEIRKIGTLKPFIISLIFIGIGILIPLYKHLTANLLFYSAGQFYFIAVLCILYDVRDVEQDKAANITTFPVTFSLNATKAVCVILLLLYVVPSFFIRSDLLLKTTIILFLLTVLTVTFVNTRRHSYYFLYLTDGLIIIQCLTAFCIQYL